MLFRARLSGEALRVCVHKFNFLLLHRRRLSHIRSNARQALHFCRPYDKNIRDYNSRSKIDIHNLNSIAKIGKSKSPFEAELCERVRTSLLACHCRGTISLLCFSLMCPHIGSIIALFASQSIFAFIFFLFLLTSLTEFPRRKHFIRLRSSRARKERNLLEFHFNLHNKLHGKRIRESTRREIYMIIKASRELSSELLMVAVNGLQVMNI